MSALSKIEIEWNDEKKQWENDAHILISKKEYDEIKCALEIALSKIYAWAVDGHAKWCEKHLGRCTCGHRGANELLNREESVKAETTFDGVSELLGNMDALFERMGE